MFAQQQRYYGQCDSYFVVDDDEDMHSMAERNRERTRLAAKERQKVFAEELSRLTADEYQEDVLDHMEVMEAETMPDVSSIDIQTEIQWYMRPYLLDFLIEAHASFRLLPDTLFLAINLLDRYCSRRVVYKRHYQLVGCAALFIAAKYNDKKENVPTVKDLRSMCCKLYDEDMFLQMEWHVLQTLNWQIGHPTVDAFLQLALHEEEVHDTEAEHMTWYLCELALFHKDFVSLRPSVLARSALALSRCILGRPQIYQSDWACNYDSSVILNLANYLSQPSQVLARKYSYGSMSCVAQTVDFFLQTQQANKAAAAAAAQAEAQAQSIPQVIVHAHVEAPSPTSTIGTMSPQTPQKPVVMGYANPAVMQNGCLTPPITPETDAQQMLLVKSQQQQQQGQFPPTPTPVPSQYAHYVQAYGYQHHGMDGLY